MRTLPIILAVLALAGAAAAQQTTPPPPPAAPPPPPPTEAPSQTAAPSEAPVYNPGPDEEPAPPDSEWTREYDGGQWVFTADYGWIWVPGNAAPTVVESVPYVFLYTPAYGWTWYVSPWGFGPYRFGPWVRHVWHPAGWRRGWVAHPRVIVRVRPAYRAPPRAGSVHRGGGGHRR